MVIGACIEVHRVLGPGLLESAYEACLAHELTLLVVEIKAVEALLGTFADREFSAAGPGDA